VDGPASGNAVYGLDLLLGGPEICCPSSYYIFHRWWRRWKADFLAVVVHYGVVLSEKGILNHDLNAENMREDGEGCSY